MSQLTFPVQAGELKLTVVVGLRRQAMVNRLTAGLSLPAPIWANGVIDTGSSITSITYNVIQRLGMPPAGQTRTHTAAGPIPVRLFRVSLSIPPAGNLPGPMLTRHDLLVMELINPPSDVEVLIGLDILLDCQLFLEEPGRQFTLDF